MTGQRSTAGHEQFDARIRFRLWVDAVLVDETWLDMSNPELPEHMTALRDRHLAKTDEADRLGSAWLLEWWDPEEDRYQRFGTDVEGMVDPRPMPPE